MIREIVHIDESKCDGCGLCVPACHEGAIRIVDGKARIVADRLCDGMGACLGHCPRGAITIEKREAPEFDEAAVQQHLAARGRPALAVGQPAPERPRVHEENHGGGPGSRLRSFAPRHSEPQAPAGAGGGAEQAQLPARTMAQGGGVQAGGEVARAGSDATPSELAHWPVQLRLLPPVAPVLRGASLLIAADCVPVAYADFQSRMLRGRAVLIGCPKFDDLSSYVEKLTQIIAINGLHEILVARMEVPCCGGILGAVLEARRRAGVPVPVRDVVVGVQGEIRVARDVPVEAEALDRT
jgi:NAD-dependent dihydropyrimidine dehydrogenase PreA subunit